MNVFVEPTYLRYVYDGLQKGSLNSDNAANLPNGFIGAFEEVFNASISVKDRQNLLQQLGVWVLLKKAVTTKFVANVLQVEEESIKEVIERLSTWFNSPEPGKYSLYHERLKVFLLQKISEKELEVLNEILILRLEKAIEQKQDDEFEWYALEFIGAHIYILEADNKNLDRLSALCYDSDLVARQISYSEHYEWPKINLKYLATSGVNKDESHIIQATFGLLKTHQNERSDVESIFRFFKQEKIELALLRIDSLMNTESNENKLVFYFQLFDELLEKTWCQVLHLQNTLDHLIKQVESSYSSSYVNFFQTIERIWERGLDITLLFKYFDCEKSNYLLVLNNYSIDDATRTEVYKKVGQNFALTFFSDREKVQFLAINSENIEDLEQKLTKNKDAFTNIVDIKSYLHSIKSIKFIDERKQIDLEIYGMSELLFTYITSHDRIEDFISY